MADEQNAQAESDLITPEDFARIELAKEKEAGPVENLVGLGEPQDFDAAERAEYRAALDQAVYTVTDREVASARETAAQISPALRQAWTEYAERSADNLAFVTKKLAEGFVPDGPPQKYQAELAAAEQGHAAQRQLKEIFAATPPGSPGYTPEVARRVNALYTVVSPGESIVGRGLRRA